MWDASSKKYEGIYNLSEYFEKCDEHAIKMYANMFQKAALFLSIFIRSTCCLINSVNLPTIYEASSSSNTCTINSRRFNKIDAIKLNRVSNINIENRFYKLPLFSCNFFLPILRSIHPRFTDAVGNDTTIEGGS